MLELRAAIDELDSSLVKMLAQRMGYIDRAIELKTRNGLPANIPARVEDVVAKVTAKARAEGFDPALTEDIWRKMISWSIAREERALSRTRSKAAELLSA
jgi:isochorismate pyruvate lyase